MNTKIIMSGISVVSALAMMGGATFAAFSASATSNNNTFAAGTLNLTVNGATTLNTPVFNVSGAKPGDSSDQVFALNNTGSVDASSVKITGVTVTPSDNANNIGDVLTIQFYNDANNNNVIDSGEELTGAAHLTDGVWNNLALSGLTIPHGTTQNVKAKLTFDSGATDNYQGKSATFSITFQANQ